MPLVDDADVQVHLPIDKLKVEEIPDDKAEAYEYAERIVRGHLGGVYDPLVLAGWTTPALTPPEIRLVAGMLAASKIYRVRYSENSLDDPGYAQTLYNEAMAMLMQIVEGDIVLTGVDDPGLGFTNEFFEPTNASIAPFFAMGDQY